MERTSLTINTPQWNLLQERCPDDGSSRAVGHRAEALAIIHIKRTYAGSQRVEWDGSSIRQQYGKRARQPKPRLETPLKAPVMAISGRLEPSFYLRPSSIRPRR